MCSAHRLNLVETKIVSCSIDAVDLFGNIETVYNFIYSSKIRVAYYENKQKNHSTKIGRWLKQIYTSSWMSHDYAVTAILETYEAVINTLEHVMLLEGRDDLMIQKVV